MSALPDARTVLAYVANLTEQAACRVLNATDIAGPLSDDIENSAKDFGSPLGIRFSPTNWVSTQLKHWLPRRGPSSNQKVPEQTRFDLCPTDEIMMAQDFHPLLDRQVIKKTSRLPRP